MPSFLQHNKNNHLLYLAIVATAGILLPPSSSLLPVAESAPLSPGEIEEDETRFYEIRAEYERRGCSSSSLPFGPIPDYFGRGGDNSATSTIAIDDDTDSGRGMTCACGVLHGMAMFLSGEEEEDRGETEDDERNRNEGLPSLSAKEIARSASAGKDCVGGKAGSFPCKNVDMIVHLPLSFFYAPKFSTSPEFANDVWGWVSDDGREFIIVGTQQGHFFVEVVTDDDGEHDYAIVGVLPGEDGDDYDGIWRDVKVVGNFAYMGTEIDGNGMQIFDLTRLLDVDCDSGWNAEKYCYEFDADAVYGDSKSHNIVASENQDYVYMVGSQLCKGGLHAVDVSNPKNPKFAGCFSEDKYVHDAQCVMYKGPDNRYTGREICFCYNEDTVTIVDATNKSGMTELSRTSYSGRGYTHQGWLSTDQKYIVFGDEYDEYAGIGNAEDGTRTLIMNVANLENPTNFREYISPHSKAIDHNQYTRKASDLGYDSVHDLIFQANYGAGLRILRVLNYATANFEEIAYFDTYPSNNKPDFDGAWSTYPYLESGVVAISSGESGLFLVKPDLSGVYPSLTDKPTESPTKPPTKSPTKSPTKGPTKSPTKSPTDAPTDPIEASTSTEVKVSGASDSADNDQVAEDFKSTTETVLAETARKRLRALSSRSAAGDTAGVEVTASASTVDCDEVVDGTKCLSVQIEFEGTNLKAVFKAAKNTNKAVKDGSFLEELAETSTELANLDLGVALPPCLDPAEPIEFRSKENGCKWVKKRKTKKRCKKNTEHGVKVYEICRKTCSKKSVGDDKCEK